MKVKCVRIYNEQTKQYQEKSSWLSINKEYIVLEMLIRPQKEVSYRLVGDNENKMPAIYDARQFEIVTNKIPSNWIIKQLLDMFIFSPASWREPGFWENCYDHYPAALEIYRREVETILEEENIS